jgi:hypothetical protein
MKNGILPSVSLVIVFLLLLGCGDSTTIIFASFNGSTTGSNGRRPGLTAGIVSVSLTDAKPMLPYGTEEVWITFEEVFLHREGGDWISLPLLHKPYTIDLLQFHSGHTTELIRPVDLEPGAYDRMRIALGCALVVSNGDYYPVAISTNHQIIEESFYFDLEDGGSAEITVDFDLSQSLRATGSQSAPTYELMPVLHLNRTEEAALIHGEIDAATFDDFGSREAIVTVHTDSDLSGSLTVGDEEYTRIRVDQGSRNFTVFWLAPEKGYTVSVEMDGSKPAEFEEFVYPADLQKGTVFKLNYGNLI